MPHSLWDVSSPTRDRSQVPCIPRWILNHWIPGKSPFSLFFESGDGGRLSLCFQGCGNRADLQKVSQGPGGKEEEGFRSDFIHPPSPCWAGMPPPPTKLRGYVALKLAAVNVVSDILIDLIIADLTFFDGRQVLINRTQEQCLSPISTAGPLKASRSFPV